MYIGNELMAGYAQMRSFFEEAKDVITDSNLNDPQKLAKLEELIAEALMPVETTVNQQK